MPCLRNILSVFFKVMREMNLKDVEFSRSSENVADLVRCGIYPAAECGK